MITSSDWTHLTLPLAALSILAIAAFLLLVADYRSDLHGYGADWRTALLYGVFASTGRVAELRCKLEKDPADPRNVLTVWKSGYPLFYTLAPKDTSSRAAASA